MTRILIISANALGDTYLSCSPIEFFYKYYNDAEVDLVTLEESAVFTPYLGLNEVFYVKKRSVGEIIKAKSFLGGRKYDFVYSFFPGRMNTALTILANSGRKYFYRTLLSNLSWHSSSQSVYFNSEKTEFIWKPEMNFLDRINLVLQSSLGVKTDMRKPLFKFPEKKTVGEGGCVVINFCSRSKSKSLEKHFVSEISGYISRVLKKKVIVLDFDNVFSGTLSHATLSLGYDFPEIMNIIVTSALFISVDSFLIHPADAHGVNLLGVFGPTNPGSVLSPGKKDFVRVNPLKNMTLETIVPSVRKMLGEE